MTALTRYRIEGDTLIEDPNGPYMMASEVEHEMQELRDLVKDESQEAAELQTFLTIKFPNDRMKWPEGIFKWALNALNKSETAIKELRATTKLILEDSVKPPHATRQLMISRIAQIALDNSKQFSYLDDE